MEVSTSLDLESILRYNGVSKENLKRSTIENHRNKIAQKIGGAWESLATFIGVPLEDVDDIKEKYREPLDRKLAMMRRWYELWGEEATYLKLVKGLRQIGRKDLIESVVGILRSQQEALIFTANGGRQHRRQVLYYRISRFSWLSVANELQGFMSVYVVLLMICLMYGTTTFNHTEPGAYLGF